MASPLENYPNLERLTAVRHRSLMGASLRSEGLTLEYAEELAKSAIDYESLPWYRRFSEDDVKTSPIYSHRPVMWDIRNREFVTIARRYADMGLPTGEFTPYIRAENFERILAAGHSPRVLGLLTRAGMFKDEAIIEKAFSMPADFSNLAMAMDVLIEDMEEIFKAGLADPYALVHIGPRAFARLKDAIWEDYSFEDTLARIQTFPYELWEAAEELGITVEMAAKVEPGTVFHTKDDILAAVFPELPRDYAVAML